MKQSKFLNILFLLVLLASMMGSNTSAVRAEAAVPLIGTLPNKTEKITQNVPLAVNVVSDWNAIVQEILQPTSMMMGGISMATAFVYFGYAQAAVYDALLAIEGGYRPYAYSPAVKEPTASREAAVAAATYTVLSYYF